MLNPSDPRPSVNAGGFAFTHIFVHMSLKNIAISILVVLVVSLVAGGVIGYRIKKCPEVENTAYKVNLLSDSIEVLLHRSDSIEFELRVAEQELELLRKSNEELMNKRPQTKPTLYNAVRYVNSADFATVVDSVLARPE